MKLIINGKEHIGFGEVKILLEGEGAGIVLYVKDKTLIDCLEIRKKINLNDSQFYRD